MVAVLPKNEYSGALGDYLAPLLPAGTAFYDPAEGLAPLRGQRLLFAVALDESGCNEGYYRLLSALRREENALSGALGAVVVTGRGEFYTRSVARELILAANMAGCGFIGHPLAERTGSLRNLRIQARTAGVDEETAFRLAVEELITRLTGWTPLPPPGSVLALHASVRSTSNTLTLWDLVKRGLPEETAVEELCLRNGEIMDCRGCAYTTCLHFGEGEGCFYGGPMVERVFPALKAAEALVMLCANYNDALAANLTAFVNRLTALYRQSPFYDKRLYALVVSGYSGGDILASQLVSGLNINKGFTLPPGFCLMETANERGDILRLPGIEGQAAAFGKRIGGKTTI